MEYRPGDLLAFYRSDTISPAIEFATFGPSHVGIVAEYQGDLRVFESTSLCKTPDLATGRSWSGVQVQRIEDRIEQYGGKVKRLSLVDMWQLSTKESSLLSHILCKHWIGKPYDIGGAILSGTQVFKWTHLLPYPCEQLFCSQLVAACLMRLCRLGHENPAVYNPASLIRRVRREGKYSAPEWVDNRPSPTIARKPYWRAVSALNPARDD